MAYDQLRNFLGILILIMIFDWVVVFLNFWAVIFKDKPTLKDVHSRLKRNIIIGLVPTLALILFTYLLVPKAYSSYPYWLADICFTLFALSYLPIYFIVKRGISRWKIVSAVFIMWLIFFSLDLGYGKFNKQAVDSIIECNNREAENAIREGRTMMDCGRFYIFIYNSLWWLIYILWIIVFVIATFVNLIRARIYSKFEKEKFINLMSAWICLLFFSLMLTDILILYWGYTNGPP